MPQVASATVDGTRLRVEWMDGHRSTFHAVWLRDNCPCRACRHESGCVWQGQDAADVRGCDLADGMSEKAVRNNAAMFHQPIESNL